MAKKDVMRFELLMDAGNGAQKAGDILIKTLAKSGRYVYIEPLIPAEISPPKRTPHSLSGAVIRVANRELTNIGSTTDLMLAEHEILLNRRLDDCDYSDSCIILLDMAEERRAKEDGVRRGAEAAHVWRAAAAAHCGAQSPVRSR